MTAATLPAVHAFTASAEDRRRCTCGKSRNTSVHGYDKNARAARAFMQARAAELDALPTEDAPEEYVTPADLSGRAPEAVAETGGELRYSEHGARYLTAEELAEESPADARQQHAAELAQAVTAGELTFDAAAAELLGGSASAYLTAPLAVVTVTGAEETVQAAPTSAGWVNPHARTAAVLPSQARKAEKAPAARGRKVEPGTRALWVARELVAIILDSTDPAHAVIVRKLSAVIPNNRGGRTIRLTEAEAVLLSGMATEIETAVIETQADGAGRLARSCVTMRARLAALWA